MKTIRKGSDIVVRWRIFRYGQEYDIALYRESISLVLSNMGEKKEITDYSIVDVNTIVFKYRAEDQGLGIYRLLLIDKSRNSTRIIEECNAFRLVNTSDAANNDDTLESAITITLTSELTAPADGLSAYEVALQNGFIGTEEEWLQSLKGEQGPQGIQGDKGDKGDRGNQGDKGLSAYQVAIANGFVGTEEEWLQSLVPDTTDIELAEAQRQAKELERIEAENTRQSAELERQNASTEAVSSANEAASNANEAAITAQQKAGEANAAASSANAVVEEFNSIIVQETGNSQDKVMSQKAVTDAMTASQVKLSELDSKTNEIKNSVQDLDGDTFYVTDAKGNIVAKIDADGVKAIEVMAQGKKLSEMPDAGDMKIASILENFYEAELFITDAQGNVIFGVDKYGIHSIDIHCDTIHRNRWFGKIMATYGDSVTAINNGNWNKPYIFDNSPSDNGVSLKNWVWGNRVASYYGFNKHYGRGFGGQWWKWNTDHKKSDGTYKLGGDLCKFNTQTGVGGTAGGTDVGGGQYDYDDYLANPSIISLGQNEVACRGSLCSWNRIQTCFPVNIKDTIDLVMIINHNDTVDNGEITWVENSNVDTEWVTSGRNYYGKVNGDYNIDTLKGAIASTIMKLQMWMPQAIIVVCTPISGQGTTGQFNKTGFGLYEAVAPTKDACLKMSIPCIDVFGTDGINGMNRTSYIADGIHPYTKEGSKMIARAIIGGLKCIEPKDLFND